MGIDHGDVLMNPLVSVMHRKEKRWSAEYAALRKLCLESGLDEVLKWGKACYQLKGGNVVLIHGFKHYCALLFMKGALLEDPDGILVHSETCIQNAMIHIGIELAGGTITAHSDWTIAFSGAVRGVAARIASKQGQGGLCPPGPPTVVRTTG